jgi:protein-S-isoprenylcysteine O-methyltransferase Ste14
MKLFFTILRSIIYVPLFIFVFWWIAENVRVYDPRIGVVLPPWTGTAGIIVMIAGGILVIACVSVFITRGKGTPAFFDPPTEFVATGPYLYVRNPMYIGGLILLIGFGLYRHSITILIFSVVYMIIFHLFVVYYEEPTLGKQFGKSYEDYKRKTNRWIPEWK